MTTQEPQPSTDTIHEKSLAKVQAVPLNDLITQASKDAYR